MLPDSPSVEPAIRRETAATPASKTGTSERTWLAFGFAVVAASSVLFCWHGNLPFMDLPNHVTRAYFVNEIVFQGNENTPFELDLAWIPYLGGDLLLALMMNAWPAQLAGIAWMTISFFSLPLGMWFYVRTREYCRFTQTLVLLSGCYVATNASFLEAATHYCIASGVALAALGCQELASKSSRGAQSIAWSALFSLLTVFVYGLHFAAFVMLAVLVAVRLLTSVVLGTGQKRWLLASLVPVATVGFVHRLFVDLQLQSSSWSYREPLRELVAGGAYWLRYWPIADIFLMFGSIIFGAVAVVAVARKQRRWTWEDIKAPGEFALGIALLYAFHLWLPQKAGAAGNVDSRVLPFLAFYVVMFVAVIVRQSDWWRPATLAAASGLALANLFVIWPEIMLENARCGKYVEALEQIPDGSDVFPVASIPRKGRIGRLRHHAELLMLTHGGFVPYLFGANHHPDAHLRYFRYKKYPDIPLDWWYVKKEDASVNWSAIQKNFDFLAVTKPFDASRFGQLDTVPFYENDAVSVFRLNQERPLTRDRHPNG